MSDVVGIRVENTVRDGKQLSVTCNSLITPFISVFYMLRYSSIRVNTANIPSDILFTSRGNSFTIHLSDECTQRAPLATRACHSAGVRGKQTNLVPSCDRSFSASFHFQQLWFSVPAKSRHVKGSLRVSDPPNFRAQNPFFRCTR